MFCGEIQSCLVHLINTSSAHSISRVRLATSQPHLITTSTSTEENLFVPTDQNQANWTHPLHQPPSSILNLVTQHHPLPANSTRTIRLWIRASPLVGRMNVDFLFLYESDTLQQPLRLAERIDRRHWLSFFSFRHRTVKHSSCFETTHSLAINSQCQATGLGEMILPIQIDNLMAVRSSARSSRISSIVDVSRRRIPSTSESNNCQRSVGNGTSKIYRHCRKVPRSPRRFFSSWNDFLSGEIRYGESLSIVFKCVHRDPHGTLAIKNISFDEKKASKYVNFRFVVGFRSKAKPIV